MSSANMLDVEAFAPAIRTATIAFTAAGVVLAGGTACVLAGSAEFMLPLSRTMDMNKLTGEDTSANDREQAPQAWE